MGRAVGRRGRRAARRRSRGGGCSGVKVERSAREAASGECTVAPRFDSLEPRLLLAANFIAYNDLVAGPTTHPNTTTYGDNGGDASGLLRDVNSGAETEVLVSVAGVGIHFGGAGANPAAGTDAYNIFDGFTHIGSGGDSIEIEAQDSYTYTFSNLSVGNEYDFAGTAVRGNDPYVDRWTLVTLDGAESFTAAHSTGVGVITTGLAANQVAIWTGQNHHGDQGWVAQWLDIDAGADGEFEVLQQQYRGPTPGVGSGDSSGGSKGYGLTVFRLIETAPDAPPTLVTSPATQINAFDARIAGEVTDTGGQAPIVTLYYGTTDGGTNVSAWQHSVTLPDAQPGAFSAVISGLSQNTQYHYRAFGENDVGGAWAPSSATFTTLAASLPAVTTGAATNIGAFSATLAGEVTDAGNDPPIVRLYYGAFDAGTSKSGWDDFVELDGGQAGPFSENIADFDPQTTYFYRAFAENAVGESWAGATLSFTTTAPPPLNISEFMADNETTLTTRVRTEPGGAFGDPINPDWLEIHNPGVTVAVLDGFSLTDDAADLNKWTFPDGVTIAPGGQLVVFASGDSIKDATLDELGYLHAGFSLGKGGEYLALVDPSGVVVHEYAPEYPQQIADVSYGLGGDGVERFYNTPTPGAPNVPDDQVAPDPAAFSVPSSTFTGASIAVELTSTSPGATIYYTTNGATPTTSSNVYSGPISITTTTQLRALVVGDNGKHSRIASQTYVQLASGAASFTSDLPIVVVDTFDGSIGTGTPQNSFLALFEQQADGRSTMTSSLDLGTRAGVRVRGSSSAGFAKKSFAVEFWDETNDDFDVGPLGMPAESDWVLYAPGTFDRALINNPLVYELSNEVGRYAVRTRYVELYLNTGGGAVSGNDYAGLYLLMERIKRGDDRVDVEALSSGAGGQPVEGGFMLKIDRADPGDSGFSVQGVSLRYVDPKEDETTAAQRAHIRDYMDDFLTALNGSNFTDPLLGYEAYIDVDSFIDHHIINTLAHNVDALRLSTFMFKTADGKLEMGPVWDFDRALESTDSRDNNPEVWVDGGTSFFTYGWWDRLFDDPDFWQAWIDRWQELRGSTLSDANLNAMIDRHAAEIAEAAPRNYNRWSGSRFGDFAGEIAHLKDWLFRRTAFIDGEFVSGPSFDDAGGVVNPGTQITLSGGQGALYYTTDGSDPRADGGGISANAAQYGGAITINQAANVIVRARSGGDWSGPVSQQYFVNPLATAGDLAITELNYNPTAPTAFELGIDPTLGNDDFEFVELMNVGSQTVNLFGVTFTDGIDFTFDSMTLEPGQRVVIVENIEAYLTRYGTGALIGGEYGGNLDNGGEAIAYADVNQVAIQSFTYNDSGDWPGRADGDGSTLEVVDVFGDYDDDDNWRSSSEYLGTPGGAGLGPDNRIVINEVLSHTDPPLSDAIELYNTTGAAIDISGWYLSDSSANYQKFRIPDDTVLAAGGYIVFDETDFNASGGTAPNDFALNSYAGDDVSLLQADASTGSLQRFVDDVSFGAAANGESFGRYPNGDGGLFPMLSRTLGGANSEPRVGPVIISEVHYNPADPGNLPAGVDVQDLEFVEIYNPTNQAVDLTDWRLRRGVDYDFAAGLMLGAGETLVIIPFDPADPLNADRLAAWESAHGVSAADINLVGGYAGNLSNGGEAVQLQRPDEPPAEDPLFIPYLFEDEIGYDDAAPWPVEADGFSASLHRVGTSPFGHDATSWRAAAPSPGAISADATPPTVTVISINAGDAQRSTVTSIAYTFSEDVSLSTAALIVTNITDNADVALTDMAMSYDAPTRTATWTFPGLEGGTLIDGNYTLTLPSAAVTDGAGNPLDGDDNASAGGDHTAATFRYFGDGDGDRDVDFADLFNFRAALQSTDADTDYDDRFDSDADGDVDFADLFQFRGRFQTRLDEPVADAGNQLSGQSLGGGPTGPGESQTDEGGGLTSTSQPSAFNVVSESVEEGSGDTAPRSSSHALDPPARGSTAADARVNRSVFAAAAGLGRLDVTGRVALAVASSLIDGGGAEEDEGELSDVVEALRRRLRERRGDERR